MKIETPILDHGIDACGLSLFRNAILQVAWPSYAFVADKSVVHCSPSKIGGLPWLSSPGQWPLKHGAPLDFLCQIEYRSCNQLVALFADLESSTGGDSKSSLVLTPLSAAREVDTPAPRTIPEMSLHARMSVSLPRRQAWGPEGPILKSLAFDESALENYEDLLEFIESSDQPLCARLLAHPEYWFESAINVEFESMCQSVPHDSSQFVSRAKHQAEWFPLMVLPSLPQLGLMFGDMENLVVWVRGTSPTSWDPDSARIRIEP